MTVPWGHREDPRHGMAQSELKHRGEWWGAKFWHPSSQPLPPRPPAQLFPRITAYAALAWQARWGSRLRCWREREGKCGADGWLLKASPGGPVCVCPRDAAESGQGHGIAGGAGGQDTRGQMKREVAACWLRVCRRRGQPVPCPAFPSARHLVPALARSVSEGSGCFCGAGRRERAVALRPRTLH